MVKLFLNYLELSSNILHDTVIYNNKISLNKGIYNLYFNVHSKKGIWCSCTETKDGFYMSRFLSKWEYNSKNNNTKYILSPSSKIPILIYPLIYTRFYKK